MSATRFLARLSLSFVVLGVGQLASATDAGAAAPRDVLGHWATSAPVFTGAHPAGVNVQLLAVATAQFGGDFAGSTLFTGKFIFDPQGNIRGHATEKFTGTVSG
jgi:hypothetical protein